MCEAVREYAKEYAKNRKKAELVENFTEEYKFAEAGA